MSERLASVLDPAVWSPSRALLRHQREAATQILESIDEGSYVTLLGPHFSGKTLLVQAVAEMLAQRTYPPCVYVDLSRLAASTVRGFFGDLTRVTVQRLSEATRLKWARESAGATSADYRSFLVGAVAQLDEDLVLLLDHLESLPTDLAQALLTSLRAAYMEQTTLNCRLLVVASGALSFAGLTLGESSPFRGIARRVYVRDLSEQESEALIAEQIEAPAAARRARRSHPDPAPHPGCHSRCPGDCLRPDDGPDGRAGSAPLPGRRGGGLCALAGGGAPDRR
jgi:type II secretory pathway predicted ATPase ExeA